METQNLLQRKLKQEVQHLEAEANRNFNNWESRGVSRMRVAAIEFDVIQNGVGFGIENSGGREERNEGDR